MNRELTYELAEREQQLFVEWRKRQAPFSPDGQFIADGIVHFPSYTAAKPRLLFLLKEPNDPPMSSNGGLLKPRTEWNLAEWLGEGAWEERDRTRGYKSWEVIARWVHDISNSGDGLGPWATLEQQIGQHSIADRAAQFRKIAVVNIKKSGGKGSTDLFALFPEIEETKDLIISQIRLCSPTCVICGGTFTAYRDKIACESEKLNFTPRGVRWYLSPRIGVPVIDYPHYTYFPHLSPAIKPAMHYGLVDAVRSVLNNG